MLVFYDKCAMNSDHFSKIFYDADYIPCRCTYQQLKDHRKYKENLYKQIVSIRDDYDDEICAKEITKREALIAPEIAPLITQKDTRMTSSRICCFNWQSFQHLFE